jgi:hypothetical protein
MVKQYDPKRPKQEIFVTPWRVFRIAGFIDPSPLIKEKA